MRVRRQQLGDRATFETYLGDGSTGPVYGPARTVLCRVEPTSALSREGAGDTSSSSATVTLPPTVEVLDDTGQVASLVDALDLAVVESRVAVLGATSRVASVTPRRSRGRLVHVEVATT